MPFGQFVKSRGNIIRTTLIPCNLSEMILYNDSQEMQYRETKFPNPLRILKLIFSIHLTSQYS
jgi:hypothetical protein